MRQCAIRRRSRDERLSHAIHYTGNQHCPSPPGSGLAPFAAVFIAAEMLLHTGLHLDSGTADFGPIIYWLVVAAICGFLAYGRFVRKPV